MTDDRRLKELDDLAADLLDVLCDHYTLLKAMPLADPVLKARQDALLERTGRLLLTAADTLAPGTALP